MNKYILGSHESGLQMATTREGRAPGPNLRTTFTYLALLHTGNDKVVQIECCPSLFAAPCELPSEARERESLR